MKKISFVLAITLLISSCGVTQRENATTGETETNSATKGAIGGALLGAVAGLLVGDSAEERQKNALMGAVAGGGIGAGIGYYFDRQEKALRDELAASGIKVQRVSEGELQLIMENGIGFNSNSYLLDSSVNNSLNSISKVLVEYPETALKISGHTDSTGSVSENKTLSQRRAGSVSSYLQSQGVTVARIHTNGLADNVPICDNATSAGRRCNRRVEIKIVPLEQ